MRTTEPQHPRGPSSVCTYGRLRLGDKSSRSAEPAGFGSRPPPPPPPETPPPKTSPSSGQPAPHPPCKTGASTAVDAASLASTPAFVCAVCWANAALATFFASASGTMPGVGVGPPPPVAPPAAAPAAGEAPAPAAAPAALTRGK